MKISELIDKLSKLRYERGDIDVGCVAHDDDVPWVDTDIEIVIDNYADGQPVVVIQA